jgi:hypothetical protein
MTQGKAKLQLGQIQLSLRCPSSLFPPDPFTLPRVDLRPFESTFPREGCQRVQPADGEGIGSPSRSVRWGSPPPFHGIASMSWFGNWMGL